jgi:hypothetical protein
LIATAVTPATYTNATITVDADGRITGASSGAAGGIPATVPILAVSGPSSGIFTASPTANRLGVYMYAGGGGGSFRGPPGGRDGGAGGFGFYNQPIAAPFSQPYSVGGAGNSGGFGPTGGAGGNTTFTNVGTVNGGTGASMSTPGTSGNAPGATNTWSLRNLVVGFSAGSPGGGSSDQMMEMTSAPAQGGTAGALVIFDNTGA